MKELLTAAQMRALERAAIRAGEVTGLALMERAGEGIARAIGEEWPDLAAAPARALVLCGPGNNGGDGFVTARLLRQRGWAVEVFFHGAPERLPPDARVNHDRWARMGTIRAWHPEAIRAARADLIVDAVFGAGLRRCPPAEILAALAGLDGSARLVAVDAPTGLCMDSGRSLCGTGMPVRAGLTVTFHAARPGHFLAQGPEFCGKLWVQDIGLRQQGDGMLRLTEARPDLIRKGQGHKYDHGHALILAGGPGRGGAARMAAWGGLRIGAGLVTLACPPAALPENAAHLNAVMLRALEGPAQLSRMLEDARLNAVGLGPGLGVDAQAAALVGAVLDASRAEGRGVLCDADALTVLAGDAALRGRLHGRCVLTPHAGEFARLFPDIAEKLAEPAVAGPAWSKLDATRAAAARLGCVVVYKGPDTVIAEPGGRAAINSARYERSAPWLATAGAGDVLAGFITGLLARGLAPMQAAETAAWLHVEAALSFGPGLTAEDLPRELPKVFRNLGL